MEKNKASRLELRCPCCDKEAIRPSTKVSGTFTSRCAQCRRLVLWNFDSMTATPYKRVS